MNKKKVTIGLVCYNNSKYIYDALNLIFVQTYPNIELIISDDGSKEFDKEGILQYIESNKSENINNIIMNINEKNLGTVKNINKILELYTGDYIMLHACDDQLQNAFVLEKIIDHFDELGKEAYAISTQVGMYDEEMRHFLYNAMDDESIHLIKTLSPEEMYIALSYKYIISAGGIYFRKELFEVCGKYDERFFLAEDIDLFSRMSLKGIKTYYLDIVSMKHRKGGISHGNSNNTSLTYKRYLEDLLLWYKLYSLPNLGKLPSDKQTIILDKYNYHKHEYDVKFNHKCVEKDNKVIQKEEQLNTNQKIKKSLFFDIKKELQIIRNITSDVKIQKNVLLFIILTVLFSNGEVIHSLQFGQHIQRFLIIVSLISVILLIVGLCINILCIIYHVTKNIQKSLH